MELEEKRKNEDFYQDINHFFYDCGLFPQDLTLHIRHITDPGDFWTENEDEYGTWPASGLCFYYSNKPTFI